jgi:hypothetical protein
VIERARFNPSVIGPSITKDAVQWLGVDPGAQVDEAWWDEMLVAWFEEPEKEEEKVEEETPEPDTKKKPAEA